MPTKDLQPKYKNSLESKYQYSKNENFECSGTRSCKVVWKLNWIQILPMAKKKISVCKDSFLAKYLVQKCEPWVNVLRETFKAEGLICWHSHKLKNIS